jgi:hypothetical protein
VRDAIKPWRKPPRVVQLTEILVRLQENILTQVQSVFTVADNPQQVIVDTPLPSGNEQVVPLYISPARLTNQVGVFDRSKDQSSGSLRNDAQQAEKV